MICAQCTEEMPQGDFCPNCGKTPHLDGRYRLEAVVGHGANGTTYRATRLEDGAVFAIKELLVRKVESLKAIDLFQREVRVLGELDHPGVPDFVDSLDVDAGRSVSLYLVQEFVDGATLAAEFAARRGTEREVFELAAELLDTLAYLHDLRPPVIHRDIKPGNVMRRAADGSLVLIDFGTVRDAVDTAEGGSTVAGTFGYMAPEQFVGRALPATDIYGVGATIVALLSRKDPQELVGGDRTIAWKGKLGLSRPFASILERMLVEDPERRASSGAELARDIRAALRGELVVNQEPALIDAAAPLSLDDVPPAPRSLPKKFRKTYATGAGFNLLFGGLFMGVGGIAGLVPLIVAISSGEWAILGMSLLFGGVFGGLGFAFAAAGYRTLKRAKQAYQHGVPTEGVVMAVGPSSYRVNNNAATVYKYEFAASGRVHQGEFHTWDALDLGVGRQIVVLVDPDDPASNVLYDPMRYDTTKLVHRGLLEAQRRRDELLAQSASREEVVFDHVEEEENVDAW